MLRPMPIERPELSTIIQIVERMIDELGGTIADLKECNDDLVHPPVVRTTGTVMLKSNKLTAFRCVA
jgi:hypothetical protein